MLNQLIWTLADEGQFDRARAAGAELIGLVSELTSPGDWRIDATRLALDRVESIARFDPQRKAVARLRKLREDAIKLDEGGEPRRCIPLYEEALKLERDTFGHDSIAYATLARDLGRNYQRLVQYDRAEPLLRESVTVLEPLVKERSPVLVRNLGALCAYLLERLRYDEAEKLLQRAMSICERIGDARTLEYAELQTHLAWVVHRHHKDYARAEKMYEEAQKLRRSLGGEETVEYADSLTFLSWLARERGDLAKAETLQRAAVDILRKKADGDIALNQLGGVLSQRGNTAGAVALLREIISLRQERYGRSSPRTRQSLDDLAKMLAVLATKQENAQDWAAATRARGEVIAILIELKGPDDSGTTDARLALDRLDRLAQMSVDDRARIATADRLVREARDCEKARDYAGAIQKQEQATKTFALLLGESSRDYAMALGWLGRFHRVSGDLAGAEPIVRNVLEWWGKVVGLRHPLYADAVDHLLTIKIRRGDWDGAESVGRQLVQLRETTQKPSSDLVSRARPAGRRDD